MCPHGSFLACRAKRVGRRRVTRGHACSRAHARTRAHGGSSACGVGRVGRAHTYKRAGARTDARSHAFAHAQSTRSRIRENICQLHRTQAGSNVRVVGARAHVCMPMRVCARATLYGGRASAAEPSLQSQRHAHAGAGPAGSASPRGRRCTCGPPAPSPRRLSRRRPAAARAECTRGGLLARSPPPFLTRASTGKHHPDSRSGRHPPELQIHS